MAMVRNTKAITAGSRRASPRLTRDLSDLVRTFRQAFSDTYHPELHYMRGPGPKWHAKHGASEAGHEPVPAFARVEA